jgi:hypothetical protein
VKKIVCALTIGFFEEKYLSKFDSETIKNYNEFKEIAPSNNPEEIPSFIRICIVDSIRLSPLVNINAPIISRGEIWGECFTSSGVKIQERKYCTTIWIGFTNAEIDEHIQDCMKF